MRLQSLSSRLFTVTAVALLPAIAIAVSSLITLQRDRTKALHDEARRTAELVSLELEQTVAGVESVLRTIAAAPVTKAGNLADCSALLLEAVAAIDFLAGLVVLNEDGRVRCTSDPSQADADFSTRNYVVDALRSGTLTTGTATDGMPFRRMLLPIALRIGGGAKAPTGVGVAFLDLHWLADHLTKRTLAPGGSLTIADRSGTILARMPEPERFVGTVIQDRYLHLVGESWPGTEHVVSQDGTPRIIGYIPPAANSSGLYVSAGVSTEKGYAILRTIAARAVVLTVVGTALAWILASYTARVFIAKPVGILIRTVADWRNGDTTARTGLDVRDGEIGRAGQSLDSFMDELLAIREARKKSDEARELMRDELEHREKNLLATVQAIARQTFPQAGNEPMLQVFLQRLRAISEANRLLKQSNWQSTRLQDLVGNAVSTFIGADGSRVVADGPDLVVRGNVATALAMSIHELCTNAVKYGTLSNETGTVSILWDRQPGSSGEVFTLHWTERGGPVVQTPERTGFGSKVIRQVLSAQTGGTVEIIHDPRGLECRLTASAEAILAPAAA